MPTNLNEEHSVLGKGRKVPSVRKVDTRYLAGGERRPPPGGQPRGSAADALGVLLGKANCRGRVALAAPARGGLALGLALLGAGRILNDADDGRPSEEDLLVRSKTRGRATLRRPKTRFWRHTSESWKHFAGATLTGCSERLPRAGLLVRQSVRCEAWRSRWLYMSES